MRDPDDYPDPRDPTVEQAEADRGRAHHDDLIAHRNGINVFRRLPRAQED